VHFAFRLSISLPIKNAEETNKIYKELPTQLFTDTLVDKHTGLPMAMTAENLAEQKGVSREEADGIALQSQQRWAAAQEAGRFKEEITPIMIKDRKKGEIAFEVDEHARPQTKLENLTKLKALFKKNGTVTAGNASGISDGAGAVIIASGDAVKNHSLTPLARIVSYGVVGVGPEIMGYGPVPAVEMALKRANLTIADMDLVEINEAFASQFAACANELGVDMSKTNTNGGAIAIGHPTGASGSRIMGHLAYELRRTGGRYAVGSACIGGGQGIAIIIERC
jgi:acetyl-CoA acyltransferase 2